jgi:hypothetical protein
VGSTHFTTRRGRPDLLGAWRGMRSNPGTGHLADPFAVNPIRRSFGLVTFCILVLAGPFLISESFGTLVMLSIGWIAAAGFVLGLPVLLWSVGEYLVIAIRRRICPTVDQLDISPRVAHILFRFGYEEIDLVDQASDGELMHLSNMDARSLRELRRAIAVWKYRRWQERGFPATGFD